MVTRGVRADALTCSKHCGKPIDKVCDSWSSSVPMAREVSRICVHGDVGKHNEIAPFDFRPERFNGAKGNARRLPL